MKRRLAALVIILVLVSALPQAQNLATQIQIAVNQLITGVTVYTRVRLIDAGYINWGSGTDTAGYGIRSNSGTMQAKNSGGTWTDLIGSGGNPIAASYWTRVSESSLTNETIMGNLATALIINTTTTGVPTAYAGTTCTNQFVRALNAVGVASCAPININTDTTGSLAVSRGGTGLTSGTSGGILGFTGGGTLASSGVLTDSRLIVGGGAGSLPTPLADGAGTATTILHGNASGEPTWAMVTLTTDVGGILPGANGGTANGFLAFSGPTTSLKTWTGPNSNATLLTDQNVITAAQGGTGQTSYAIGDLLQATGATTLSKLAAVATGNALISGGVTTASSWGKIGLTTHVTGTLGATNGGTGLASYTTGDLLYASSGTSLAGLNDVAVGQVLISAGAGVAPAYSANPRISTLLLGADLAFSSAAPTISSGFGTGAAVSAGTAAAFRVNVGTGGTATAGVIGLPTATTGWNCSVEDITATTANAMDARTVQLSSTTATATVENQTVSTGAALAWTASDILAVSCTAF